MEANMAKKIISLLLVLSMCFSMMVTAFADPVTNENMADSDSLSAYDQYVIVMGNDSRSVNSASFRENGAKTKDISYGTTLDNAVEYVQSLDLASSGYEYIEQSCLDELQAYEDAGVELEYYAVLVPNGTASTDYWYGTYNGVDFYYSYTSVSDFNMTKSGKSLDASDLKKWVEGAFNFILGFACTEYSIAYSLFSAATSGSHVTYETGSSFKYIFQFYEVRTRAIYTYDSGTKRTVINDQRGITNLSTLFIPAGGALPSLNTSWTNRVVTTSYFNNSNRNLQRAYINYVHKGSEYWSLSTELLSETWR